MAVVHALEMALALLALVCLPALVAAVLCADELVDRLTYRLTRWRAEHRQRRVIDRLDRGMQTDPASPGLDPTEFEQISQPAFEQIVADLHRLGQQRLSLALQSSVWHSAVLRGYDERLRMACRCLGVAEHLAELDGVDLEIERVRVEGELQAAGLILPTAATDHRHPR